MELRSQAADYASAVRWVTALAEHTPPAALDGPTPCSEYSVRTLLGHLLGTAHRSLGTARGESTRAIPHVITDVPDNELASSYATHTEEALAAWGEVKSDASPVLAPWGACTALEALRGFTVETLVHGWDLALATGQDPESCEHAAERALGYVDIPQRLVGVMYNSPVSSGKTERPTTELARRLGRPERCPS